MKTKNVKLRFKDGELNSGKVFLSVTIDGTETECFFDTGATFTGIKNASILKSNELIGNHSFQSASGAKLNAKKMMCESLELGSLKLKQVPISILPEEFEHDTTIGIDTLSDTFFTFNSLEQNFSFNGKNQELAHKFSVTKKGHISIDFICKSKKYGGIWDTGVELTVVSRELVESFPELFSDPLDINNGSDSTGNKVSFTLWNMSYLEISGTVFNDVKVLAMDFTPLKNHFPSNTEMIFGYNLITKANWNFDMSKERFDLTLILKESQD
ncbi:retropepsin-like aspartic protease [Halobacteriovorax sp. GB3]|uniref:retropepsin-like aspartic protease n=1 Tax=Halobacteriovorax sp. GB3 TaxID=2719615 RepID=UPI0023608678|nr:retropepsin-like aspartic protease [Halobacteriovorax sp. GB3]MDD0852023.1 retropepsin-like aspartic protease [Halobacteriovorax sp. GB3]